MFANIAGASYCSDKEVSAWDCGNKCDAVKEVSSVKICRNGSTSSFVALWEGQCIVSFKGTNSPEDILHDLEISHSPVPWAVCPGCEVHDGFLSTFGQIQECIETSLNELGCPKGSSIRTTGHSLGAAVQALAMIHLSHAGWKIEESYDFARPRVGNENTANYLNKHFGDRTWRVTRKRDPIPLLPFYLVDVHWTHSMPEVYYKDQVSDGYEMCSDPADHSHCSEKNKVNPVYIFNHEFYMGITIGSFNCKGHFPPLEMSDVLV